MDDFEAVLDDADSQELLAVVPSVHHQGVDQTLNDGALSLAEPLAGVPTSGVGQELRCSRHGHNTNIVYLARKDITRKFDPYVDQYQNFVPNLLLYCPPDGRVGE